MESPNFRVDGKVALITGSGRGIGLAIGQALASAGASVVLQDIEREIAQAEADRINAEGGKAIALGGDLTDLNLPEQLIAETQRQLGGVDILINNGSIQTPEHWSTESVENMRTQIDTDLLSPILLTRLAAVHMKARQWGRIVNITSIMQRNGSPKMLAYSLAKSALDTFTRAAARDLGGDHITVNSIAPGWINTLRNRGDFPSPEDVERKGKNVLLGRVGWPADFVGIALLLCSEAGSYITGQCIFVDGGLSVR